MMNYHEFVISEIDLIAPSAGKYGSGTIKKNSSDSSHSFLDATWSMIDKNCGEVCASRKGGFGLSTGKRVQPPPRLYFRWVESGTMIMAFVLYARFLLGHNSTISNKRDASDLILVYLQGLDLLPSLLPTATKHRLLWLVSIYVYIHPPYQIELPCIYLSPRWRFWQGYLPFDVYTLRPWRDSSLRVVRHRGPWIVLVLRESCQTRPKERPHVARIVLARAAIYCVFEIMQSSGCRLPPRWLLCTSIPLLSLFLFLFPPNPLSPLYLCT